MAGGLHISESNDACEHEADRVADAALSGRRPACLSLSKVGVGTVQRQKGPAGPGGQPAPQPNNYGEAAGKLAEAFPQTDVGKKLTDAAKSDPLAKGFQDFIGTLPGKIFTGAAASGAVSAMAATHTALPAQIPDIPLDSVRPGLSVHITYEGAVDLNRHPPRPHLSSTTRTPPRISADYRCTLISEEPVNLAHRTSAEEPLNNKASENLTILQRHVQSLVPTNSPRSYSSCSFRVIKGSLGTASFSMAGNTC